MSDYQSATSPAENGEPRDLLAEPDAPEDRADEESTDIASAARALGADDTEAVELPLTHQPPKPRSSPTASSNQQPLASPRLPRARKRPSSARSNLTTRSR